jgi:hypothetical protein
VQDSPNDWQTESGLMGNVYSHCLCTLAAAAAKKCHEGLFPVHPELPLVEVNSSPSRKPVALIKPPYPGWDELFNRSLLNKRGWTLQERELSPRVLYFNKHTVLFECREARGGERGDSTKTAASDHEHPRHPSQVLISKLQIQSCETKIPRRALDPVTEASKAATSFDSTNQKRYEVWREMVQGYSRRKLSVPTDKFPALSGLASEFSFLLNDEYIAGLWKRDIIVGLCWSCEIEIDTQNGGQSKYGPSWSWTKITVPIRYKDVYRYERHWNNPPSKPEWKKPTFLDICIVQEGKDLNGTLRSASISLQGQIIPIKRLKTGNCIVGGEMIDVGWDFLPQPSTQFYLLSLGRIRMGLVLVQDGGIAKTYSRVGMAPMIKWTWFEDVEVQSITLVCVGNNVNSPIRTSAIGLLQHLQLLYFPSELDIDEQIQQVTLYFYYM